MIIELRDELGNTIPINSFLPFENYVSNCANSVSDRKYRSGSFMASSNQKIYIYSLCNFSGNGYAHFDIAIFR